MRISIMTGSPVKGAEGLALAAQFQLFRIRLQEGEEVVEIVLGERVRLSAKRGDLVPVRRDVEIEHEQLGVGSSERNVVSMPLASSMTTVIIMASVKNARAGVTGLAGGRGRSHRPSGDVRAARTASSSASLGA